MSSKSIKERVRLALQTIRETEGTLGQIVPVSLSRCRKRDCEWLPGRIESEEYWEYLRDEAALCAATVPGEAARESAV